ncbi:MAG TPA: SRPBCC family protein [Pedobacter sp.]|nr:SRPBCC family protein [Pedobacter sp.]
MNILLSILLFIVVLIVFLLFLALIVKKEYTIQRDINIRKPIREVFDYVKLVKNQEQYSKWVMLDPNVKLDYRGIDGTIGFISAWEGNKQAGKGEQEIKKIEALKLINMEVRFEKPFKNIAQINMYTTAINENETNVKWEMVGSNKYPMTLFNLFIDNLLGKDLSESLSNLKRILEK